MKFSVNAPACVSSFSADAFDPASDPASDDISGTAPATNPNAVPMVLVAVPALATPAEPTPLTTLEPTKPALTTTSDVVPDVCRLAIFPAANAVVTSQVITSPLALGKLKLDFPKLVSPKVLATPPSMPASPENPWISVGSKAGQGKRVATGSCSVPLLDSTEPAENFSPLLDDAKGAPDARDVSETLSDADFSENDEVGDDAMDKIMVLVEPLVHKKMAVAGGGAHGDSRAVRSGSFSKQQRGGHAADRTGVASLRAKMEYADHIQHEIGNYQADAPSRTVATSKTQTVSQAEFAR